jgi:hypothetical protein
MSFVVAMVVTVFSGLYTSLWGAFKDSPYETFKLKTFPRSIYFNVAILIALYFIPYFSENLARLGMVQVFFLIMGIERFVAELYKGFFRTEDQSKYFVPSRITFFGSYVDSNLLRHAAGALIVAGVFSFLLIEVEVISPTEYLLVAYGTGLLVALGGAYKDAPFEGFKWLKFQRSGLVLALLSPLLYLLGDPLDPLHVGFLIYMNGGLERFAIEYYKTFIQRNMSGKFRPDLQRIQKFVDRREKFHYMALAIMAALVAVYLHEIQVL